jgi:predicted O-methyltransferase YrrM
MMIQRQRVEDLLRSVFDNPGFFRDSGWLLSMERGEAVDREGRPIPWLTYPALDFLADRVHPALAVFEYGTGNSTLWWGPRVSRLVSCEHDKEWFAAFKAKVTCANTTYLLRRCKGGCQEYQQEISGYRDAFDILVIDGRERVDCMRNGFGALRLGGVVIWDNSDREEYRPGYTLLADAGFRRLDFWGPGPLATRRWCTSIFYRSGNCLGI